MVDFGLGHVISMLIHQLPWLLACGAALSLLWPRTGPPVAGQTLALAGVGVLLGATLLRLASSSVQGWMLVRAVDHGEPFSDHTLLVSALKASGVLLGLASAAGLVLLALGASRAMRALRGAPSPAAGSGR